MKKTKKEKQNPIVTQLRKTCKSTKERNKGTCVSVYVTLRH